MAENARTYTQAQGGCLGFVHEQKQGWAIWLNALTLNINILKEVDYEGENDKEGKKQHTFLSLAYGLSFYL